jgi:hypothetical protein
MKKPEKTCPPFQAAKEGRQVECYLMVNRIKGHHH